jgi:hypothetical protein
MTTLPYERLTDILLQAYAIADSDYVFFTRPSGPEWPLALVEPGTGEEAYELRKESTYEINEEGSSIFMTEADGAMTHFTLLVPGDPLMSATMKKEYVITDPCYILGDKNGFSWTSVLEATAFFGIYGMRIDEHGDTEPTTIRVSREEAPEYFIIDGQRLAGGSTGGDGIFSDDNGFLYEVDSGTIACVPVELLESRNTEFIDGVEGVTYEDASSYGRSIMFTGDVSCKYKNHVLTFSGSAEGDPVVNISLK